MKKIFIKAALLIASFGLVVSCASNTRSENTTIGAVSGAVAGGIAGSAIGAGTGQVVAIGVGAVAGAIIGGVIGHNMESSDDKQASYVMEHNAPNKPTHWKNKKTKKHYTLVPTSQHIAVKGNNDCRNFHAIMYNEGDSKKQEVTGIACRQANGSWQATTA
jgi:surface antigen